MYGKTITLFNYYESKQTGTYRWYPSVLQNVDLITDKAAILAKYGQESQDSTVLHVRHPNGAKEWIPPKEWEGQVNENLSRTLTFAAGDFFWQGEWQDTEPIDDTAYKEGFYDYMSQKYDFVFRITKVGGPYTLIPHFEIMGR